MARLEVVNGVTPTLVGYTPTLSYSYNGDTNHLRFTLEDETKTIQLSNLSEIDIKGLVNTTRLALVQLTEQLDPSDTDLLNLRDEILGKVNKYAYLFTME